MRTTDPFGIEGRSDNDDWPRNGAIIKGMQFEKDGTPWLRAVRIRQAGVSHWTDLSAGKWMAFDGGAHNGGQWLHETAETDGQADTEAVMASAGAGATEAAATAAAVEG